MSILASRIISDVKEDFQGGTALSVDWSSLLRRAARNMLGNVNPDTLKLRRAVYGGITGRQFVHFMPEDIVKPTALYENDGNRKWDYMPPTPFFAKAQDSKFTVASTNGVRFLIVAHSEPGATLVIDEMDDVTDMTGGTATPAVNANDYVSGTAAVQATFDDTGKHLIRTIDSIDITDYLRGTAFVPIAIDDASKVASIQLRLRDGTMTQSLEVTTADDDISDFLVNGWNFLRFDMRSASATSQDLTAITDWMLIVTATTGNTVTCIIDRMTLQKTAPLWLEGYTDKLFIDPVTGAFKSDVDETADLVNVDEELAHILHYELCLLVEQAGDASRDGNSTSAFSSQLGRAYNTYYENHPSEQLPVTYNIQPDLNRQTDAARSWDGFRNPPAD